MKNSMGNDSQKFIREVRKASRAIFAASAGMASPWEAAMFQRMIFFCMRQMMPHTLSIMNQPSPPPMPMESARALSHALLIQAQEEVRSGENHDRDDDAQHGAFLQGLGG